MAEHQFNFPRFGGAAGTTSSRVANWAVVGIFLILAFAAIAAGRDFLMPVTLGVLLFFVFTPMRRFARRRGLPDWFSATAITVGLVLGLAVIIFAASGPVNRAASNLPTISVQLEQKFRDVRQSVDDLREAARQIEQADPTPDQEAAPAIRVEQDHGTTLDAMARFTPTLLGQIAFTLFLLFFMLASGDLMYLKIVQSFDTLRDKRSAYMALREIEDALGSYLGAITVINACLGIAVGVTMWAWGMPAPLLFGIGAFILNYIPYLGSLSGVAIAGAVALVTMEGVFWPAMVAGSYLTLTAIEGQLITPLLVSRRLQMNAVVVFLAVALWAWLWSIIGMVIAVPVLVVMRVLAEHVPGWEKFGNFLAGEDPPALEDDDEEAAREIVAETPAPPQS